MTTTTDVRVLLGYNTMAPAQEEDDVEIPEIDEPGDLVAAFHHHENRFRTGEGRHHED